MVNSKPIEGMRKEATVQILPFTVPNYVRDTNGNLIHIRELQTETLYRMIERLNEEIMKKHESVEGE